MRQLLALAAALLSWSAAGQSARRNAFPVCTYTTFRGALGSLLTRSTAGGQDDTQALSPRERALLSQARDLASEGRCTRAIPMLKAVLSQHGSPLHAIAAPYVFLPLSPCATAGRAGLRLLRPRHLLPDSGSSVCRSGRPHRHHHDAAHAGGGLSRRPGAGRVASLTPGIQPRVSMGVALMGVNRHDEAQEALRGALRLAKGDRRRRKRRPRRDPAGAESAGPTPPRRRAQIHTLLAAALRADGRAERALRELEKTRRLLGRQREPDPQWHVEQGRTLDALGRLREAKNAFHRSADCLVGMGRTALLLRPDDPQGSHALSDALAKSPHLRPHFGACCTCLRRRQRAAHSINGRSDPARTLPKPAEVEPGSISLSRGPAAPWVLQRDDFASADEVKALVAAMGASPSTPGSEAVASDHEPEATMAAIICFADGTAAMRERMLRATGRNASSLFPVLGPRGAVATRCAILPRSALSSATAVQGAPVVCEGERCTRQEDEGATPPAVSSSVVVTPEEVPELQALRERAEQMFGLRASHAQVAQLLRYLPGHAYRPHTDCTVGLEPYDRMGTLLVYLSDVEEGGGTAFSRLNLTVTPLRGRAAAFWSMGKEGFCDPRSEHEAVPVGRGEKLVLQQWYLARPPPSQSRNGSPSATWVMVRSYLRRHAAAVRAVLRGEQELLPEREEEEGGRVPGAGEESEPPPVGDIPFFLCDASNSCREYRPGAVAAGS